MKIFKSRYLYILLVGIVIFIIIHSLVPIPEEGKSKNGFVYSLVLTIGITFFVWEGSLRIDKWMNKVFPWDKKPIKRAISQSIINVVYSITVILTGTISFNYFVCHFPDEIKNKMNNAGIVVGALITLIIMSIEIGTQFFNKWKMSLAEVEKYKTESLQAQLQNLKNQINPHFLFNNMSVLSSLVYKDQDKAVNFINQMSKVYRYLLDNRSSELVTLADELVFIRSYTYLLQIRFDTNIIFNFDIKEDKLYYMIPTMSLQILIENAIKHNEVSSEQQLTVSVTTHDNILEVSNNLQLRTNKEESCKTGLQNIKDRYQYFTNMVIEVTQNTNSFIVKLPLLNPT
jgi:two-component system, LytTR family, sensor kinase